MNSPMPPVESERLDALKKYAILDTPPEPGFERLSALAARQFKVPIAFISFIDADREWFKSTIGHPFCSADRDSSFCGYAILSENVTVVTDTLLDPRFAQNPSVVSSPQIRFFAAAPLRTSDGFSLGGICVADTSPRSFSDDDRSILRDLAAVVVDTMERRRAELELRLSEERLRLALDAGRLGSWDWWMANGTGSRSPTFKELYGFDMSETVAEEQYMERVHPEDRAVLEGAVSRAIRDGEDLTIEYRIIWPDSSLHWLELTGQTIQEGGGRAARITGTLEDVTHRKRSQQLILEARQQAEEARLAAEQASQAKSEFLSRMSHELRTPLNAVLGFAQLLEMDELKENQRNGLSEILKAGRHLLELINEVLEISRIESGKMEYSLEAVEVADAISTAVTLIGPFADQSRLRLIPPRSEPRGSVLADRHRLHQVLVNLLSNAVKYNRAEGEIRLTCEGVGDRVRIGVTDTGAGISETDIQKLFVPFERLGARFIEIEGTGIGLALCRRLMEGMGGTIGVESRLGEGSTFWIELPQAAARIIDEGPVSSSEDTVPALPKERHVLLYIEDNLSNVRLVEHILDRYPQFDLLVSMQGRRGLELAHEHQPDLIFLDLHLPDIRGDKILAELRAQARTRDIPVIMVTADATSGQRERLLAAGADYHLTKPLNVREFLEIIELILKRSDGEDPAPPANETNETNRELN